MPAELPVSWVSIDPGDIHVGLATWHKDECRTAREVTPDELVKHLETYGEKRIIEVVVYEKFALYAWNEKSMAGNEFLTCQLIGVIKYLCNRYGMHCVGQFASQAKPIYRTGWFRSLTRTEQRAMPWWGNGNHAKDAWAHGQYFVNQRKKY